MYYDKTPLYPFGYGLSYTTYQYSDLTITPQALRKGDTAHITFKVKNTGSKAGAETAQLYIHTNGTLGRQKQQLKGFERITLAPGEEKMVTLSLPYDELAHYNPADGSKTFDVERGNVDVMIGASSADIRLRGTLNVAEGGTVKYTYEHPAPTRITGLQADKAHHSCQWVYNAQGNIVGTANNFDALPAGFYILNGEKVIKQNH